MKSFIVAMLAAVVAQCGHAFVVSPVVGQSSAVVVRSSTAPAAQGRRAAPLSATKEKVETELLKKADFISEMAEKSGLNKSQAEAALAAFVETMADTLSDGKKVNLQGLGTFEPRFRAGRAGRNPRTGEALQIKASYLPAFTASKTLKERVRGSCAVDE